MTPTRLQDDLLHEFREEQRTVNAQLRLIEPLAVSLRKQVAVRLAGKGLLIAGEVICWALVPGAIAFCIFLNKLYPFYILADLRQPAHAQSIGLVNVQTLTWSVYALIGAIGILLIVIARCLARIRKKNDILQMAGQQIKTIVGQHLARKAALDALEQRHFNELPPDARINTNAVPNPAYEAAEGIAYKDH